MVLVDGARVPVGVCGYLSVLSTLFTPHEEVEERCDPACPMQKPAPIIADRGYDSLRL